MSHLSLYRLYRPKTFKDVIGQKFIVHSLMNAIKTNRVVHAYIFAGSRGTGKTSIAKIFAKAINCLSPINGDACGLCEHCKLINDNQAIDVIELDAASNNGIDDVRQIIETAQFLPSILNKKVYIIDEAHMLTTQAWNALLKTIEESPKHVIFIFATTELHKIPPTIVSRCQQYLFNRLNNQELTQLIKDVCNKQTIKIDDQSINKIISLADGSARDTLSIIEQISIYSANDVNIDKLNKVFGLLDNDKKIDFINRLISGQIKEIFDQLDNYFTIGVDITQLTHDIISLLIDKLIYLQTKDLSMLKILNANNINAFDLTYNQLIEMINIWQEVYGNIKIASDSRFYFELAIFKCLKIFNKENDKSLTNTAVVEIKTPLENIIKQTNITLPPLNEVVSETEVNFKKIQPESSINEQFDIKKLFFEIASNNTSDLKQSGEKLFNELKMNSHYKINGLIRLAIKLITASKNGMLVLFEDEVDAKLFNDYVKTYDGLIEINKVLGRLMYVVGYTRNELSVFTSEYMSSQKSGKKFLEPDISILEKIVQSKSSIVQLAFDIFS